MFSETAHQSFFSKLSHRAGFIEVLTEAIFVLNFFVEKDEI